VIKNVFFDKKVNKRAQRALGRSPEEMLYIKYESSMPCSFRQEEFWKLPFENLFITYAINLNGFNNFDRRPHRDHSCEGWSSSH